MTPSRRAVLVLLGAPAVSGCWGLLLHGGKNVTPRSRKVEAGVLILDIFLGLWIPPVPLGLIIDIAAGTLYRPIVHRQPPDTSDNAYPPAGEPGVPIALCLGAPRPDADIEAWSAGLERHLETCPACCAALLTPGPAVAMPARLRARLEVVRGERPVVVDLDGDAGVPAAVAMAAGSMSALGLAPCPESGAGWL